MRLIDTHCHIDVDDFSEDRDRVIAESRRQNVGGIVVPGITAESFDRLDGICKEPLLFPAFGLHPVFMNRHAPHDLEEVERRVAESAPVAIGEIGLDYFIDSPDVAGQKRLLEAQLVIARETGLPVLLHIRKAHDHVLAMLRRMRFSNGGIAHAFNGSRQQAEQFIGLGFKLGFGGVATYERSRNIRRLAVELPLDAIVLETDAPDLPPVSHRGERNSPAYLPEILIALSELRGEAPEVIAGKTTMNAVELMPALA
ncbi:TatD family hydrolase [Thiohalomonas denitrificans]|uniref:TatD DNase family protein n=1 Tax=Thiohalomonas denitrificans TaxID=415747 RepID=A0A1G5QMZ7_9GAMM|nr:TatD family hydrolase [Thiohalomonas denitrificans]SCZ62988.1 TatD DNase family protein [Thiohalomonas denitrificans]